MLTPPSVDQNTSTARSPHPVVAAPTPPLQPALAADALRPVVKQVEAFLSVLGTIVSAEFYKCSVADVRNAFKWAELIKKYLSPLDHLQISSIRNVLLSNPAFNQIDVSRAMASPIEYTVELIIRSPLNGFRIGKDVVYLECFRSAYASLGPDRTMQIISTVLGQTADCNAYVNSMQSLYPDEAVSHTSTVFEFCLVRELASVLLKNIRPHREGLNDLWDHASVIVPLKAAASADRITLSTLCILISSDCTELRARACISVDLEENIAMKLFMSPQLWSIIYENLSSNMNYFLASVHSSVLVKMCRSNGEFLHQLETKLVTEAEDLLRQYMSSNGSDVNCLSALHRIAGHLKRLLNKDRTLFRDVNRIESLLIVLLNL